MEKITIVDSIMGSGKTSAMLNYINSTPEKSYIYVTPFLDEVDRVIHATRGRFRQPHPYGKSKIEALRDLLADGADIATTHALFWMVTPEIIQLIHEGQYTLILDEELETLRKYNDVVSNMGDKAVSAKTVAWLIGKGYLSINPENYQVEWHDTWPEDYCFFEIGRLAKDGCLRCIDNTLYCEYPIEAITAFENVFVLTYLFEGSALAAYLKTHGLSYTKMSASNEGQASRLCPYNDGAEIRAAIASLINIYDGRLNHLGNKVNAFSVTWLEERSKKEIEQIKNAMRSYRRFVGATTSTNVMWTTIKKKGTHEKLEKTRGFKYIRPLSSDEAKLPDAEKEKRLAKVRCFVPCNARATNNFKDRTILMYLINRYPQPNIEKYYSRLGYSVNEEVFALSEMIQWIWRSAIREGKPINIFIPSSRMRRLLKIWLAGGMWH